MTKREIARRNLNIDLNKKIIISVDGGGMRGIFTIQLLKKLEEIAGSPIYCWADMVAGTSTGAIISGLILAQKSAIEIEDLYIKLVSQVFKSRGIFANRFLNPPAFDKVNYRDLLSKVVQDQTLSSLSLKSGLDIMITSKDIAAGEEAFFTCFNDNGKTTGTYKDILLRGAMEATMSAPTYFTPFERFVDGGTTSFNNPCGAAVLEALCYDGKNKYKADELVVFSFGTSTIFQFINPLKTEDPKGLDVMFWLNYVMAEASKDASEMQTDMLRSGLIKGLDFRRFQLSLDEEALHKLNDKSIEDIPNEKANWLHELTNEELSKIDMSDVTKFPLMKILGEAVVEYICPPEESGLTMENQLGNWFRSDLINKTTGRGQLVTSHGDVNTNNIHLKSAKWIDGRPT